MPNWTSNEVRFKSRINSKRQLSKLKKRLRGVEYLVELASGEKTKEWNDFDFNKIHKMPKALEDTVSPTQDGDEKKAEQRLKTSSNMDFLHLISFKETSNSFFNSSISTETCFVCPILLSLYHQISI